MAAACAGIQGAIAGFILVGFFVIHGDLRAADRAVRPARGGRAAHGRLRGALARPLGRARPAGARRVLAHRLRRPLLARDRDRRRSSSASRSGSSSAAIAGYFGGTIDSVIMRCMDVMLSIPSLLLAIGIVAVLGPGFFQIMIAIGHRQHPHLRAAPARLGARAEGERLRARRALRRRSAADDPLVAHPPELGLAGDRPGDARHGDRHHRRRRRSASSGSARPTRGRRNGARCSPT